MKLTAFLTMFLDGVSKMIISVKFLGKPLPVFV